MTEKHPIIMAFAKGAAVALGYFGMKYLITYVNNRINDPNHEPFIKITFRRPKDGDSDNA